MRELIGLEFFSLYKGLVPLWSRQIPYTMMKFACFERTLEALYKFVVPKPRDQCTKSEQLVVTFTAGYIAGVFCAIVSHPADVIVSKLNKAPGSTAVEVAKELGFKGKFTKFSLYFWLTLKRNNLLHTPLSPPSRACSIHSNAATARCAFCVLSGCCCPTTSQLYR